MKPEVNLLPKYERYSNVSYILFIIGLIVFVLLAGTLIYFYETTKGALEERSANVAQLTEQSTLLEARVNALTVTDDHSLYGAVSFAEQFVVPTSKLIDELIILLPENGYLSNYVYDYDTVQIETQFESINDTANYVDKLTRSSYMENAVIDHVETFNLGTDEPEAEIENRYNVVPRYNAAYSLEIDLEALAEGDEINE